MSALAREKWHPVLDGLFARYAAVCVAHRTALQAAVGDALAARTEALCNHARQHLPALSEDKANRWLGFVQGVLTAAGLLDVEVERDHTRPLFHALKGVSPSHDVR